MPLRTGVRARPAHDTTALLQSTYSANPPMPSTPTTGRARHTAPQQAAAAGESSESGTPPISALRPAKEHIGRLALATLTTRLREGDRPIRRTVVLPELNVRESSAARLGG